MSRQRHELEMSQRRLQKAIDLLVEELELVQAELSSMDGKTRLDRTFFWRVLVPMLFSSKGGMTSQQIYDQAQEQGARISIQSLRVFLSRYKERGSLALSSDSLWRPSKSVIEEAIRQGYDPEWFSL